MLLLSVIIPSIEHGSDVREGNKVLLESINWMEQSRTLGLLLRPVMRQLEVHVL